MRILFVAQTYFPYLAEGGRPAKVRTLSQEMSRRGHTVSILTAQLGAADWEERSISPEKCDFGLSYSENGVRAVYLSSWLRYRSLTLNPSVIGFSRSCLGEFDLIHVFGLYDLLGPSVIYFCRRSAIPYVIEPMGMFLPIDRSLFAKRVWHATAGSSFWREASLIVATSELEEEELLASGVPREKVVVRYNGIEAVAASALPARGAFREKHSIASDEPLVLFLSRLIPRKGADMLIEAFAEACPRRGRLVIAGPEGEPGYLAKLQERARAAGVSGRVIFTGPVYGGEKLALLADADLFALPSRYENFANVAADAIACGVPVIISRHCGIRTLVEGRAGLVIDVERPALVSALRSLLGDSALYARMKDGCRSVAGELSWSRIAAQMESHYQSVLDKSHAAR
ncbi:MAG TPA: glycosyltransferase [Verrucomicrobiae bacterium]|nr:glycosyltransferase [Verrucomicrobiae bacterium]